MDDAGELSKSQGKGCGSIPDYEISSLLDRKFAKWTTASCALALACRPSVSKHDKEKKGWCEQLDIRMWWHPTISYVKVDGKLV